MNTDPLRRSLRGLFQIGFAEALLQLFEAFVAELTEAQHVSILGVAAFLVAFGQNYLEDHGAIPAVGKAPASDGENPVP